MFWKGIHEKNRINKQFSIIQHESQFYYKTNLLNGNIDEATI